MIKRTLEITNPSYLKTELSQLLIEQQGKRVASISFEDLGIIILNNPQITLTQKVIQLAAEHNCALIHCDAKHLPASLTLPLSTHSLHTKVIKMQISLSSVRRKQLWQQLVQHKIASQITTLKNLNKPIQALERLITQVKSGDTSNIEAQAAKKYWQLLMGDDFRRDPELEGTNALLNYGYAIARATVARALVGTGLHPALGIHHSNQYNSYCLADDLMEPLRAWIDEIVFNLKSEELTQETKQELLAWLAKDVIYKEKSYPFMVALEQFVANFKQAYETKENLYYPIRITS